MLRGVNSLFNIVRLEIPVPIKSSKLSINKNKNNYSFQILNSYLISLISNINTLKLSA